MTEKEIAIENINGAIEVIDGMLEVDYYNSSVLMYMEEKLERAKAAIESMDD